MKWKCKNCFEWSDIAPCEHCGALQPPPWVPTTEEQIKEEVLDRLRGGPKTRLRNLAAELELSYEDMMENLTAYVDGDDNNIRLGTDIPYEVVNSDIWSWYELVTGRKVPFAKRKNPFSCSC